MAKKFKTLRDKMSPEARQRSKEIAKSMLSEMALADLRKARTLSQERLAQLMEVKQPEISKIEKRTDMYISTLRSYIKAMGGDLEIVAKFPEGNVRIIQFKDLEDDAA